MSATLKNILDLAWSQSDSSSRWQNFSLSETVGELAEVATKLAHPRRITVSNRIAADIFIHGQQEKIFRALLNLIDNAVKFTPPGGEGKISLSLSSQKNLAAIDIKDTGIGIVPDDLPHIFDRFYRGGKSGRTLGSGLGLAIASSIIAAHHGEIEGKSPPTKGSTFTVRLPLASS